MSYSRTLSTQHSALCNRCLPAAQPSHVEPLCLLLSQDLRSFVRQYFADETWILLGPRRYLEPDLASEGTLELRPFALQRGASDDGAPAFPPICRRFKGTAASCADGWRCAMSHAMPRVFL
jgi:hypothetical protein